MPELGGLVTYPIAEPTSALAFQDLITEVAYKIGCAYYGSDGQGVPQVPIDNHDLTICQRIVNKAIRMFINDGPQPNGWSWLTPIAQVAIWPQINADLTGSTCYLTSTAYNSTTNLTTLTLTLTASSTASTGIFYPSMELKPIWLNGQPTGPGTLSTSIASTVGTPFTLVNYLSSTQAQIFGQPSSTLFHGGGASTSWSMIADGDYTLPADFSGQYVGEPSYISNTNRGMTLHWTSEALIRQRRQNYNIETGTPYQLAVRLMATPSITTFTPGGTSLSFAPQRRRWQLMTWRITSEFLNVLFKYTLGFQNLVNLTDTPPSPFAHDEALKAACLAVAEKEVTDQYGVDWEYYKKDALPKSWRIDAMSYPKRLGYNGNPRASAHGGLGSVIEQFRAWDMQRPTVQVNL